MNTTTGIETNNYTDNIAPTDLDYAYFFASMIIFLPTVIGNSLILISLYRFRELRSPMGILIGNLAVGDLLVGLILMPLEIIGILVSFFHRKYPCLVSIGISATLTCLSVANMLAISVERFVSVAYPLKHRSAETKTLTKVSIPFIWVSVLIIGFLPLMGLHKTHHTNRCTYTEVFVTEYTIFLTSFLAVCVFVNVGVFLSVVRIALSNLTKVRDSDTDYRLARVSRNLTKTYIMMIVSAAFVICWGPFSVLTVLGLFYQWETYSIFLKWSYFLGVMNSGINWMIYGFKNPKFRRAIIAVVKCKVTRSDSYITHSSG